MFLSGSGLEKDARGEEVHDDSFLILVNAAANGVEFIVPAELPFSRWKIAIDTIAGVLEPLDPPEYEAGEAITLDARGVVVLQAIAD